MKWSNNLASSIEMVIKRFGSLYRFVEENVTETIGLYKN